MRRILVFRPGALGDVLLAGPALMALRQAWPHASLSLSARPEYAELLSTTLSLDQVHDLGSAVLTPLFLPDAHPPEELVTFLRSFDLIVSWLGSDAEPFARNLRRLASGTVLAAPPKPLPGSALHASDYLLSTLAPLHLPVLDEPFGLRLPGYIPQTCDRLLADCDVPVTAAVFAVHPGAGSRQKCWPTDRFLAVAREFSRAHDFTVLWLLGPVELESIERFGTGLPESFVVISSAPIMVVAGLLERASVFLGNDSGVAHLGAMLGTPTLTLFGTSNPMLWAPRGQRAHTLHVPQLDRLTPQAVLQALDRLVGT